MLVPDSLSPHQVGDHPPALFYSHELGAAIQPSAYRLKKKKSVEKSDDFIKALESHLAEPRSRHDKVSTSSRHTAEQSELCWAQSERWPLARPHIWLGRWKEVFKLL